MEETALWRFLFGQANDVPMIGGRYHTTKILAPHLRLLGSDRVGLGRGAIRSSS